MWSSSLCLKDSDGDGRTNGEELGDSQCVWKEGGVPAETAGITHPGIKDDFTGSEAFLGKYRVEVPGYTNADVSVQEIVVVGSGVQRENELSSGGTHVYAAEGEEVVLFELRSDGTLKNKVPCMD